MNLHDIFTILMIISYLVFCVFVVYAYKKKNSLPMLISLVISSFFNMLVSLAA